jgi:large subunit ribosomal protein L22
MAKNKQKSNISKEVNASVKYVRVSPYKLRKVADIVRNLPPEIALQQLKLMPQKSATILYKLFYSCVSNAVNNFSLDKATLKTSKLIVNEGPKLKRSQPRARGRIFGILKPYSHVELTVVSQGEVNGSKG